MSSKNFRKLKIERTDADLTGGLGPNTSCGAAGAYVVISSQLASSKSAQRVIGLCRPCERILLEVARKIARVFPMLIIA